ncbi:MAG: aromatic ring-hydroxylating dioxygenase subunit alpha [Gammaproteobacteria bacterium]|nr:MAG: aromatic ring-hydroxylating dioxygenase subunit alpha [Gammaproteobacteria bacterium]TDJ40187.1 MAG: aromatic ring-hydroxylating dioxygenase subunit alpha [Gammaproteobacteria bacterium]
MANTSNGSVRTMDAAYHKLLDSDPRPIPESYRRDSPIEPGPTFVPVERYISREFHDLEVEKLWKRVWQMACHEDDMPDVGDYVPYDIAGMSFLVVRVAEDEFKAYYNACLHRGRKLRENRGKHLVELRCPFHGWCWNLDGTLREIPCQWDYPELKPEEQSLPEVKVGRWGRYIFINPDPNCEPFEDFIGDLSSHFELLPYERRYKEAHVAKIVRCNWKVASEAFMESYHVIATHPQILLGGAHDVDTKYDVFGNYSRAIRCGALESSGLPEWEPMPDDGRGRLRHPLNGYVYEARDDGLVQVTAPDGTTGVFNTNAQWIEGELGDVNPHLCNWVGGRQLPPSDMPPMPKPSGDDGVAKHPRVLMADMQREALRPIIGDLADQVADVEFSSVFFTLFPNFHPWGSFNRINYRFRPNGNNHEECIMECIYLAPIPDDGNYTPVSEIHWLGPDDDWMDAPELGMLSKVFNQDFRNLPYVQQGLHATAKEFLQLSDYNETKPRHFHMKLEEWLAKP